MGHTHMRHTRLLAAAFLVISTLVASPHAVARPSKQDLAAAKARLAELSTRISSLDEQYDLAVVSLNRAEERLATAREDASRARARRARASRDLSKRAAAAYEGVGAELGLLLGSSSISEFSDRAEFLGAIANNDEQIVSRANVAAQQARWAGAALSAAVTQRERARRSLAANKHEVEAAIADQQAFIDHLEAELAKPIIPPPPKNPPPAPQVSVDAGSTTSDQSTGTSDATTSDTSSTSSDSSSSSQPAPPAASSRVQEVLDAAYSVIGTPYVYAGSTPEGGFDCSGFTMWAWAHAGVSLPHSSAMQYDSLPHVSRDELQPGDLLFFYSPIHHVAIYVGGGKMIHSPHTGGYVEVIPVYWEYYVGAGRPG